MMDVKSMLLYKKMLKIKYKFLKTVLNFKQVRSVDIRVKRKNKCAKQLTYMQSIKTCEESIKILINL